MSSFSDGNNSFWSSSVELPSFPAPEENFKTGVLIVGGGISGLMNAYQLSLGGHEVTVIEGNTLVSGTTANTTARIMAQKGLLYGQLSSLKGEGSARLFYEYQIEAIDEITYIINRQDIYIDFNRDD